jgi:serine/threonine-protein phosphatase 2B regulatory subunit
MGNGAASAKNLRNPDSISYDRAYLSASLDSSFNYMPTPPYGTAFSQYDPKMFGEARTGAMGQNSNNDVSVSNNRSLNNSRSDSILKPSRGGREGTLKGVNESKKHVTIADPIEEEDDASMDNSQMPSHIRDDRTNNFTMRLPMDDMTSNPNITRSDNRKKTTRIKKYDVSSDRHQKNPCQAILETFLARSLFDDPETKRMKKKFDKLDVDRKGLTVEQFGNFPEIKSHSFHERIMDLAADRLQVERKPRLEFDDVLKIFSVFHTKCPMDTKLKYAFRLYDIDADDKVGGADFIYMFKSIFMSNEKDPENSHVDTKFINEDFLSELAGKIISDYDDDKDQALNFKEFSELLYEGDLETRMTIYF